MKHVFMKQSCSFILKEVIIYEIATIKMFSIQEN